MKLIVFSDMDGTFLDDGYSFSKSILGLSLLKGKNVPLIFCSSKTRAEIEYYREILSIKDPFISENGGAIFIPKNYFGFDFKYDRSNKYFIIEIGSPYSEIRKALEKIKDRVDCTIIGFGDLSPKEISEDCGLPKKMAELSKKRDYDEGFKIEGDREQIEKVLYLIKLMGYSYTIGTRYYHIMGNNDKGKSVQILIKLFKKKYGKIKSIGIGDSLNDLPMLKVVDIPVLVRKKDGGYQDLELDNLYKSDGIGPVGWTKAVEHLI
jgi:mannosyl-3-phosphoglycerate phosphatase